jgi:hypothetical protein
MNKPQAPARSARTAQFVCDRYPTPVARLYKHVQHGGKSQTDLLRDILYTAECGTHFALVVALVGYLTSGMRIADLDRALRQLFGTETWSFGTKKNALLALAKAGDWHESAGLAGLDALAARGEEAPQQALSRLIEGRNLLSHKEPPTQADARDKVAQLRPDLDRFLASLDWLARLELAVPLGQKNGQVLRARKFVGLVPPDEQDVRLALREPDWKREPYRVREDVSPLLCPKQGPCLSLFPLARFVDSDAGLPDLHLLDRIEWKRAAAAGDPAAVRRVGWVVCKLDDRSTTPEAHRTEDGPSDRDQVCRALSFMTEPLGPFEPTPEREPAPQSTENVPIPRLAADWKGKRVLHKYTLLYGKRFIGREEDLDWLDGWAAGSNPATADSSLTCLHALGGCGKTALAWNWLERSEDRLKELGFRGAFWCSFYTRGYDFDRFLEDALAFVGEAVPAGGTAEQRRQEMTRLLTEALTRERYVFVLDGIERKMYAFAGEENKGTDDANQDAKIEAGQLQRYERQMVNAEDGQLLRDLIGTRSRILMTSRIPPAELEDRVGSGPLLGVTLRELTGFTPDDALKFWASEGLTGQGTDLLKMFETFGFHPLVIGILAREVRRSSARGDFDRWREKRPDFNPYETQDFKTDRRYNVLDMAIAGLDDGGWAVLECVATHPDPSDLAFLVKVLVDGLREFPSEDELRLKLDELQARGLIGCDEQGSQFDAHPVVRGYTWKRHKSAAAVMSRQRRYLEAFARVLPEFSLEGGGATGAVNADALPFFGFIAWCRFYLASGEFEKAWKLYYDKLLPRLAAAQETQLAEDLLLRWFRSPDGRADPTALPPLSDHRDQARALSLLSGHLMVQGGRPDLADLLARRAAVMYLLAGEQQSCLEARQNRMWRVFYEGQLFQAEQELRRLVVEAAAAGLKDLAARAGLWTALVLAIRGADVEYQKLVDAVRPGLLAAGRRWTLQAIAEGYVYLGRFEQALAELAQVAQRPDGEPDPDPGQVAWERSTAGMALRERGEAPEAQRHLLAALALARRRWDTVVQGFALASYAWTVLETGRSAGPPHAERAAREVLALLDDGYFFIDKGGRWALSAAEAYAARAQACQVLGRAGDAAAVAAEGLKRCWCDGEPFRYRLWFDRLAVMLPPRERAVLLEQLGRTRRLPADWAGRLVALDEVIAAAAGGASTPANGTPPAPAATPAAPGGPAGAAGATRRVMLLSPGGRGRFQFWLRPGEADHLPATALPGRVAEHEARLGLQAADGAGARWWEQFKALNAPRWVCRACAEIAAADVTLPEFLAAAAEDAPDFARVVERARSRSAASRKPGDAVSRNLRVDPQTAAPPSAEPDRREAPTPAAVPEPASASPHSTSSLVGRMLAAVTGLLGRRSPTAEPAALPAPPSAPEPEPAGPRYTPDALRASIDQWLASEGGREIARAFRVMHVTAEELTPFLADSERRLQIDTAPSEAQDWWRTVCTLYADQPLVRVCVAEALAKRGATLGLLARAWQDLSPCSFEDCLARLDAGNQAGAQAPAFGISQTKDWTEQEIVEQLEHVKGHLGWESTTGSARKWWEAFEGENKHRRALVLRLAEELANRKATVTEFFLAYVYSNTDNIQANLSYLDYSRLKKEEERKKKAAAAAAADQPAPEPAAPSPAPVRPAPVAVQGHPGEITSTKGWTDEQVLARLETVKNKLDWENTTGSARKWWEAFEGENKHRRGRVLRLAEELANRKATVTEFFLAYVYSNTDNIQANLSYLDYTRLKKEEERKKKAAAATPGQAAPGTAAPPTILTAPSGPAARSASVAEAREPAAEGLQEEARQIAARLAPSIETGIAFLLTEREKELLRTYPPTEWPPDKLDVLMRLCKDAPVGPGGIDAGVAGPEGPAPAASPEEGPPR